MDGGGCRGRSQTLQNTSQYTCHVLPFGLWICLSFEIFSSFTFLFCIFFSLWFRWGGSFAPFRVCVWWQPTKVHMHLLTLERGCWHGACTESGQYRRIKSTHTCTNKRNKKRMHQTARANAFKPK